MNDEDIKSFLNAFSDFMKHAEVQEFYYEEYLAKKEYVRNLYEKKAKQLNVSVDYYLQEFI